MWKEEGESDSDEDMEDGDEDAAPQEHSQSTSTNAKTTTTSASTTAATSTTAVVGASEQNDSPVDDVQEKKEAETVPAPSDGAWRECVSWETESVGVPLLTVPHLAF